MLEKSLGLFFFLKKPKNEKGNSRFVYLKITLDGESKDVATKRKWDNRKWNSGKGCPTGTNQESATLTAYLTALTVSVYKARTALLNADKSIMPPMSQYDVAALPFYKCFTSKPVFTPFQVKPAQVSIDSRNVAVNESSRRSEFFNLANEDKVPDRDMNEVIWKAIKGENAIMPAPKRSAFVILEKKKEKDDDD